MKLVVAGLSCFVCMTFAGCAAPASSFGTGSFWASERGAELNDSLDRTGTHVAKFEKQAEVEIKREAE